ncbi:MAG: guanylate kinase [Flavobacteriaceae bacterium]|jgi:guanylate kinase|nr:guanylate kinase [Flavobacteriaceae bacterium]
MSTGKLIVFSAPSGAGKTSLVHYLLAQPELQLEFSISAASRQRRVNECDGVDYYFIDNETFKKHIAENAFAEYEEVYKGNFYGTYKKEIERIRQKGKNVIFDIDVEGGLNLKKLYPEQTLAVFVKPPSVEALETRLRNRKTDTEEKIQERIAKAHKELKYENRFDTVIVNDVLEIAQKEAYKKVAAFIQMDLID